MIAEAVDAALMVADALTVWALVLAVVGTSVVYAVVVAVAVPVHAAWTGVSGALAASRAVRALGEQLARHRPPQRPSWVRPTPPPELAVSRTHSEHRTA